MTAAASPLKDPVFRRLFAAQVFSLAGTGLTTVALALLAWRLGADDAGAILGAALGIKMIAYLSIAPVVGGYAHRLPRKRWLVGLDLVRALLVGLLPFVSEVWQLTLLIFVLNACAAGFTPVYQALIPDVLPDEARYTRALSLSRLAVELESLLSPTLAALLLAVWPFTALFQLNATGFLVSATLVMLAAVPAAAVSDRAAGLWHNISFGIRGFLATPRLRGVLALHLAVAAGGAMVIVNTVVYVRQALALDDQWVAYAMMASGTGAMLVAMALPRVLVNISDRTVMLGGGALLVLALIGGLMHPDFVGLLPLWAMIGAATSLVLTPTGRVLRLSCRESDRSAFFSANFALSHGMWLICYPLAGWLGARFGLDAAFAGLALLAALGLFGAWRLWPRREPQTLWHQHPAQHHEHLHTHQDPHHQHVHEGWEGPEPHAHPHSHPRLRHSHPFVIDEHHLYWPK